MDWRATDARIFFLASKKHVQEKRQIKKSEMLLIKIVAMDDVLIGNNF